MVPESEDPIVAARGMFEGTGLLSAYRKAKQAQKAKENKPFAGKNRFVIDSYALIGYLKNELFSDRIEELLKSAKRGTVQLFLHALHLGEVYSITLREQGEEMADIAYSRIRAFPLTYNDTISESLLLKAAALKAKYPISDADSFAAALAVLNDCLLLSGDPDYKALEDEGILKMHWLNR